MYCWNCGHKNADENKFCGECGKTLLIPDLPPARRSAGAGPIKDSHPDVLKSQEPPEKKATASHTSEKHSVSTQVTNEATKPEAGMRPAETEDIPRTTAKLTNPLVEEPRVMRERLSPLPVEEPRVVREQSSPSVAPALETRSREKIPLVQSSYSAQNLAQVRPRFATALPQSGNLNSATLGASRIAGPSFLGLSDEPRLADDNSYLLDEEESSSSWRGYLALAFLLILGVLVLRQWTEMRGVASDFAQRLGIGDAPKRVKAQPTVSASATGTQSGQPVGESTPTAGDSANPNSAASPAQEVAKAKPPDSLAGGKPENDETTRERADAGKTASAKSNDESNSDEETSPDEPAKGTTKSSREKSPPAEAITDNSQVDLAQRYLQGKGVPQNCNRGVSLLRSAARQANPKARIQMAALYLSGHCVEQNLPQAYSWFSQAQELEPHNAWIERNLNSLWSKMTDEERRRVLR